MLGKESSHKGRIDVVKSSLTTSILPSHEDHKGFLGVFVSWCEPIGSGLSSLFGFLLQTVIKGDEL